MQSDFGVRIPRAIRIELAGNNAFFLWGPRKVGKTTYLRERFPDATFFDLLDTRLQTELRINPHLLRERVLATTPTLVIVDEVQKVPGLLDEVHWCLENTRAKFVLCGSSARKMRRQHANLLGGRAWRHELFPLTSAEIKAIDLARAINHGTIPQHYLSDQPDRFLRSYVLDYLNEEVQQEAEVRSLPAFARFLDVVAQHHGQLINYANVARQCGVSAKTVRAYYDLLTETLMGYALPPWGRSSKRRLIETSKYFLFDTGLVRSLLGLTLIEPRTETFGRAFEHLMLNEVRAYLGYRATTTAANRMAFWRTSTGLEVDLIVGDLDLAMEFKAKPDVRLQDVNGLRALMDDQPVKRCVVVSLDVEPRQLAHGILVLPWRDFLGRLWAGEFGVV